MKRGYAYWFDRACAEGMDEQEAHAYASERVSSEGSQAKLPGQLALGEQAKEEYDPSTAPWPEGY